MDPSRPVYIPSNEALDALRDGRKIEAVKLIREQYGIGLAEAKALADAFDPNGMRPDAPATAAAPAAPAKIEMPLEAIVAIREGRLVDTVEAIQQKTGCDLETAKKTLQDYVDAHPVLRDQLRARMSKAQRTMMWVAAAVAGGAVLIWLTTL